MKIVESYILISEYGTQLNKVYKTERESETDFDNNGIPTINYYYFIENESVLYPLSYEEFVGLWKTTEKYFK